MQKAFKQFLAQEEYNEFSTNPDLENFRKFLKEISNPQDDFFSIHVAGTNGKGSVANFLASILSAYSVGLYTSPHIVSFRERIKFNNKKISKESLFELFAELKEKKHKISNFELATAIAFKYFSNNNAEFGIIECGLGGRLDATNVINSKISIITNISLEHTHILGNSLKKIAKEKAAIIKENSAFFTSEKSKELLKIFKDKWKKNNSEFFYISKDYGWKLVEKTPNLEVDFFTPSTYYARIKLDCIYQIENALLSIAVAEYLKEHGIINISSSSIANAIEETRILGRFNILQRDPLFVVDVAHNPAGILALVNSLSIYKKKFRVIFSCCNDKNAEQMLKYLKRISNEIIITELNNKRAAKKEKLLKISKKLNLNASFVPLERLKIYPMQEDTVVCGSHYLAREFLSKKFVRGEAIERSNGGINGGG